MHATPGSDNGYSRALTLLAQEAEAREAKFAFTTGTETVHLTRPVINVPQEARQNLLSLLSKLDPDSAFILSERVARALDHLQEPGPLGALLERIHHSAAERLPLIGNDRAEFDAKAENLREALRETF